MWSLGLSFHISSLDAFRMIYMLLSVLMTSQSGYLTCGLRSYTIRETEAWRRCGLRWGPPAASAKSSWGKHAQGGVEGVGLVRRSYRSLRSWLCCLLFA